MSTRRWGAEGPPEDAYSRVTNAERFRSIHQMALDMLARLEAEFDVDRMEGYGQDDEMEEHIELARPSIKLTPRGDSRAPITMVFTAFPGIGVKVGRWHSRWFPNCGCDACDETAEDEYSKLEELVEAAVSGRFRERLKVSRFGEAWAEREYWSDQFRRGGRSRVDMPVTLGRTMDEAIEWVPWQKSG